MSDNYSIKVNVRTTYLQGQSSESDNRYVFSYTITISNTGKIAAQLISRHWIITDANGKTQEVKGEGVVGETPVIEPGESFSYTSGTVVETPIGSMKGSYQMVAKDDHKFDALIPVFTLSVPGVLN